MDNDDAYQTPMSKITPELLAQWARSMAPLRRRAHLGPFVWFGVMGNAIGRHFSRPESLK